MLLKDLLEGDILISHMKSQNTDSVSGLVNQTICLCKAPDSTPGRVGIFNDTAHKHHMFPLVSANDLTAREREREREQKPLRVQIKHVLSRWTQAIHTAKTEKEKRKSILCSFNVKRLHLYV